MYRTVTRNMRKRKKGAGTWFLETTTMFQPGEESMAELTFAEAEALQEGLKKRGRHRLMYDHRWGECLDVTDELALRMALREAYGDAMLWIDLDGLIDEFYDIRNDENDSRRFFLNAKTSAADAWIKNEIWQACKSPGRALQKRDMVTIGMDGSIRSDATAVVACRVSDGHIELLGVWENPGGIAGLTWQVDREAVHACIANAMKQYEVIGMFCDPAHWQDSIDVLSNEYGERMKVQASQRRPLEFWTNRPQPMAAALERFYEAVEERRITYTPHEDRAEGSPEYSRAMALTRHVLNTRRRDKRGGLAIAKEHPKSDKKIDACMAAVLAYEAACDARAAGIKPSSGELTVPRRIR